MSDIAAPEIAWWHRMEAVARDLMERHGFTELRTPIMEYEDLFTRSIGDTTDVVQKEMYSFERSHHRLCLRPEGTAGVMRHAAGLGPIEATERVMKQTGLSLSDIQLVELNEAFAAQSVACIRGMGLEDRMDIINVNGGAIALGHPIGSSGCRISLLQDGKRVTKFACVDGPEFNGYEVDFDEAISRGRMYADFERHAYEEACNLFRKGGN